MGQRDIIDFLKRSRSKWFNASEIASKLNLSVGSVLACLRRLRKSKLIDFRSQMTKAGMVYKNVFVYKFRKPK
ncbi:hypothetical protein A3K72_02190 [Candidatus Woesearchaeota archaeon RBG_13_36_6]|nr:MAG: hypothetical protein A3K72_02190 [Candidatus Woesearchaeota archaeon RBG_13_36_6]